MYSTIFFSWLLLYKELILVTSWFVKDLSQYDNLPKIRKVDPVLQFFHVSNAWELHLFQGHSTVYTVKSQAVDWCTIQFWTLLAKSYST